MSDAVAAHLGFEAAAFRGDSGEIKITKVGPRAPKVAHPPVLLKRKGQWYPLVENRDEWGGRIPW